MLPVESIPFNDARDLCNGDGRINKSNQYDICKMRKENDEEYLFEDAQHGILFGDRNVLKIILVPQSYSSLVDLVQHQSCQCNAAGDQHG